MNEKTVRPYGLWPSPLTPASMALGKPLRDVQWDTDGRTLVWPESRSDRGTLVAQGLSGDAPRDLTEAHSVRAKVGYGGGDFSVSHGYAYYAEAQSKRIYRTALSSDSPSAVTPAFGAAASPTVSPDGRWLIYVHTYENSDCLAIVDAEGTLWPKKLATGADFYMQPTWHPSGGRIAWIEWDHPNMPWDSTRLFMGQLGMGEDESPHIVERQVMLAGDDVAVAEPRFTPDGRYLLFIGDEDGYKNLYRYDLASGGIAQLTDHKAEIGGPAWVQGNRAYALVDGNQAIYIRTKDGSDSLWRVSVADGDAELVASPLAHYARLAQIASAGGGRRVACVASAPDIPARVISADLDAAVAGRVHARGAAERVAPKDLSQPEAVSWPAPDGTPVYGIYYAPHSQTHKGRGKPPAIILIHGGPTGQISTAYNPQAQFFATRGFGVLLVDYRGSTGHGKAYMRMLRGNWGVYDVEDAVGGAQWLADSGRADPERLVIMGGSAGGYTVWLCLANHPGLFKAGVCLFGVSNLFTLAADTHKFEERYLDSMVGPLPEAAHLYRERSTIFFSERIQDPVAVFQGDIDRVVPREQSDSIVASLKSRGVPHVYHVYEGEGHGWRKSEAIESFYGDVMRFLRQYVIFG